MTCPILCDNGYCNGDKLWFVKLAHREQLSLKKYQVPDFEEFWSWKIHNRYLKFWVGV